MNVVNNLIYGANEKEIIITKENKDKIYIINGIVDSIEEWEHYYIKINEKIFILKRNNENLLKEFDIKDSISFNYIKDKNDNVIIKSNKTYKIISTVKNFKTDSFGDTYITTCPRPEHETKIYDIILNRKYYYYHKLYNMLHKHITFIFLVTFNKN